MFQNGPYRSDFHWLSSSSFSPEPAFELSSTEFDASFSVCTEVLSLVLLLASLLEAWDISLSDKFIVMATFEFSDDMPWSALNVLSFVDLEDSEPELESASSEDALSILLELLWSALNALPFVDLDDSEAELESVSSEDALSFLLESLSLSDDLL